MNDTTENSKMTDLNEVVISERKRWVFLGLPFTFTKYTVNHKKIIIDSGFFTSYQNEILLYRVLDVTLRRTLMQKIFGLGTVIVKSKDKTSPELSVTNIRHPKLFMDTLSELVEDDKNRKNLRHNEMIDNGLSEFDDDYDYEGDMDF